MNIPSKILIAYDYFPPIAEDLKIAFGRLGIESEIFHSSDHEHWFYKKIIRRINKLARNLRLVKKDIDLFAHHPLNRLNYLTQKLKDCCALYSPEMIFFIHGQPYGNQVLGGLSVPKLGWWMEPNDDIRELRMNAAPFDVYYSFSQRSLDLLKPEGFTVDYLCHSVSPERFYPVSRLPKKYDLCFVGNWSPWREKVIQAALGVTKNIALYGPHWRKKSQLISADLDAIHLGDHVTGADLNTLFNTSKVVLNASRIPDSYGLNMRFFEVLATQACFLTDAPPELTRHFEPDQHLMVFDDLMSLQKKLKLLLDESSLRDQLAINGYQYVLQHYTYDHMAQQLLNQYRQIISSGSSNL
jgi:glycosyltransferase involved in cell wall biosynthesis